jgi:hypothetical protein
VFPLSDEEDHGHCHDEVEGGGCDHGQLPLKMKIVNHESGHREAQDVADIAVGSPDTQGGALFFDVEVVVGEGEEGGPCWELAEAKEEESD